MLPTDRDTARGSRDVLEGCGHCYAMGKGAPSQKKCQSMVTGAEHTSLPTVQGVGQESTALGHGRGLGVRRRGGGTADGMR